MFALEILLLENGSQRKPFKKLRRNDRLLFSCVLCVTYYGTGDRANEMSWLFATGPLVRVQNSDRQLQLGNFSRRVTLKMNLSRSDEKLTVAQLNVLCIYFQSEPALRTLYIHVSSTTCSGRSKSCVTLEIYQTRINKQGWW